MTFIDCVLVIMIGGLAILTKLNWSDCRSLMDILSIYDKQISLLRQEVDILKSAQTVQEEEVVKEKPKKGKKTKVKQLNS